MEWRIKIKLLHLNLIVGHRKMDARVIEAPSKNLLIIFILQIMPVWRLRDTFNILIYICTLHLKRMLPVIYQSHAILCRFLIKNFKDFRQKKFVLNSMP